MGECEIDKLLEGMSASTPQNVYLQTVDIHYFLEWCSVKVISQFFLYMSCLDDDLVKYITSCDCTGYGTIVVELSKGDDVLSIEIGETDIGFFSDYTSIDNIMLEKVAFPGPGLPQEVLEAHRVFQSL